MQTDIEKIAEYIIIHYNTEHFIQGGLTRMIVEALEQERERCAEIVRTYHPESFIETTGDLRDALAEQIMK